jgi:REP element-mobilizing transposase RayT
MHEAILSAWAEADHWAVGKYVVMPDHIHLFCTPLNWERDFELWVRYWKRLVTQAAGIGKFWQSGCWDTQIRHRRMYDEKWDYTYANPVRAGLVERAEDWPFQGEVNVIAWSGD